MNHYRKDFSTVCPHGKGKKPASRRLPCHARRSSLTTVWLIVDNAALPQPVPDRLPRSAADRFRLLFGPDERPVFQSGEAFCELGEGRILRGLTACCAPV